VKLSTGVLIFVALLLVCATALFAQSPVDPSGHWEGTITAPFGEVAVEVDLVRDAQGRVSGTFTQPRQKIAGLPFATVAVDGRLLTLKLPGTGQGQFMGTLFSDGKTYSGDFSIPEGAAPFVLTRTGDPRVVAALTSPALGRDLEGRWSGTLEVNGRQLRLVLTMANQGDGTSISRVVSVDEGGMELPVTTVQQARALTVTVKMNGAVYQATLDDSGAELRGTYSLQGITLPLVLRREPTQ
jgi:hypothetical protein